MFFTLNTSHQELWKKKSLNSGGGQFYQYLQHEQLQCTSHSKLLNTKTKYDGNPGLGLQTEIKCSSKNRN
jgi:hypothetical protein